MIEEPREGTVAQSHGEQKKTRIGVLLDGEQVTVSNGPLNLRMIPSYLGKQRRLAAAVFHIVDTNNGGPETRLAQKETA